MNETQRKIWSFFVGCKGEELTKWLANQVLTDELLDYIEEECGRAL